MSYKKATIQNLKPGEIGLQLDGVSGPLVAVAVEIKRDPVNSLLTFCVRIRQLNADGSPVLDDHGQPVETAHCASGFDQAYMAAVGGKKVFVKQLVENVLGEPTATRVLNDNIRAAISAANLASVSMDLSTLQ